MYVFNVFNIIKFESNNNSLGYNNMLVDRFK